MDLESVKKIRNQVITKQLIKKDLDPDDLYVFLGQSKSEKVRTLAQRTLPNNKIKQKSHEAIFTYIVNFWNESTFTVPYKFPIGKGLNLARRPYIVPSSGGAAFFHEQYRWDTRFQNLGLIVGGGTKLAKGQLKNLQDVYKDYHKIPNALSTEFLSHSQPMFESTGLFDLLNAGVPAGRWSDELMQVIESELFTEWLDYWEAKKIKRMVAPLVSRYGFLSRYANLHFHAMLAGCEDGKDHNWITAKFGENYLPVQLNSIIYKTISDIVLYYTEYNRNIRKIHQYTHLQNLLYTNFQKVFWSDKKGWKGFLNYAIDLKGGGLYEGPIYFDELATEIFPLWAGICTPRQAAIVVENMQTKYECPNGLLTATKDTRAGSTFTKDVFEGWIFQWDYPNIWPPLMQIAIEGLLKYDYNDLAEKYMRIWVIYLEEVFSRSGMFFEKYALDFNIAINEGFYGVEKGFGWTIGTYLWMLHKLDEIDGNKEN